MKKKLKHSFLPKQPSSATQKHKYLCLYVVNDWFTLFIELRKSKYMNKRTAHFEKIFFHLSFYPLIVTKTNILC